MKNGIYQNNKTGRNYEVYDIVINATNAQDGQTMVCYRDDLDNNKKYVREINEFKENLD